MAPRRTGAEAVEGAEGHVLLIGRALGRGPESLARQADQPVEVSLPEESGGRVVARPEVGEISGDGALALGPHGCLPIRPAYRCRGSRSDYTARGREASAPFRRHHRKARSQRHARRAKTGRSSRNRPRSSAIAAAVAYRRAGSRAI